MYQIGTKWKLWDLPQFLQDEINAIKLRGYILEAPVVLPPDFVIDANNLRLSVEQVASAYCPTSRDIYITKKLRSRKNNSQSTWGQIAGHLIEEYCKGLMDQFSQLAQNPQGLHYHSLQNLAHQYSQNFWATRQKKVAELRKKANSTEESPERLIFLLQQTAKYELTMLGADYSFCQNEGGKFISLMQGIPILFDSDSVKIMPNNLLGLGDKTTPDFLIQEPSVVMGEVKTGLRLEPFHLHTIAGYALAYESQHNVAVNFGIVYFFETHSKQMNFAQSYVFVIDDTLRQGFLDRRNRQYAILQRNEPPRTARELPDGNNYYENQCNYCKFKAICYPENG